jgi:hypothetical protein
MMTIAICRSLLERKKSNMELAGNGKIRISGKYLTAEDIPQNAAMPRRGQG